MQTNYIKQKLHASRACHVGVWCEVPSTQVLELLGLSGYDFLVLDAEHSNFTIDTLEACIRACELAGTSPLVRTPGLDAGYIQRALDLGAHGILVPQIHTVEAAREVAELTHFPHGEVVSGRRGVNPFVRGGGYGVPGHSRLADGWALTGVLVESPQGFAALDDIARVEGIDIVFLGAYDYSASIGKTGDMQAPEVVTFIEQGLQRIAAAGKVPFALTRSPAMLGKMKAHGARMVAYGLDTTLLMERAAANLTEARGVLA
jgi:4-hydroxy-2-oxoheptanedioate aldolase